MILAWDGKWKTLIGFSVLDTNRSVTNVGLPLCSTKSQSAFQASALFIGKQILYFCVQN